MEQKQKLWLKVKIQVRKVLAKLGLSRFYDYHDFAKKRNLILTIIMTFVALIVVISFIVGVKFANEQLKKNAKTLKETVSEKQASIQSLQETFEKKEAQYMSLEKALGHCTIERNNTALNLQEKEVLIADTKNQLLEQKRDFDQKKHDYEKRIVDLETAKESNENDLVSCKSEKEELADIIQNSVRAVCCSFNAIQQGTSLSWDIIGNQISCGSGGFSVNCGTGVTNYLSD